MTRTFEISIEAHNGTEQFNTTKRFASAQAMRAWIREFAADWWKDAEYFAFCRDTEEFFHGRAN